uniref:Uncharacterized protein n=1 Tax=Aegilops tauschii subsp. strangulata TaxID=200361 RepID=A0A453LGL2_AEGTS
MRNPAAVLDIHGPSSSASATTEDPLATQPSIKDGQQSNSPSESEPAEPRNDKIGSSGKKRSADSNKLVET